MRTGPEHYKAAEECIASAFGLDTSMTDWHREQLLKAAQVHATLALAAATALKDADGLGAKDYYAWSRAASVDSSWVDATEAANKAVPAEEVAR